VAVEVAKGSVTATLSSHPHGKSAKLRRLPVINAADEARMTNGHTNGHKTEKEIEINV
jgi:hypothetical protein